MSAQQETFELDQYWPTTAWLDRYENALNESEAIAENMDGWGVGFNGDFVFEIRDLPLDEYIVGDLPEEVWSALETGIEQLPEDTMETVLQDAPPELREGIESRSGPLPERAAAELKETKLSESTDKVWPGLRRVMPEIMNDLIAELEENVTDDGTVYAWIGLEDGECYGTDTMGSLDEREKGFVLSGEYEQWVRLVTGELGPVEGIMSGELELEGDMQKMLQYSDAALSMTDVAAEMEKRFLF